METQILYVTFFNLTNVFKLFTVGLNLVFTYSIQELIALPFHISTSWLKSNQHQQCLQMQ